MSQHATEVATGERFEFGKNWAWFLETLNDEKIQEAVKSLRGMLETDNLGPARASSTSVPAAAYSAWRPGELGPECIPLTMTRSP